MKMADMAGDHRDFPADPEELSKAGDALDHLIDTVTNHALGEYFLKQAEEQVETYPVAIICPGPYKLHVYGPFKNIVEADQWVDSHHFTQATAFGGNVCNSGVDYDMHAAVGMEKPGDRTNG
jgi:hypothetical protein